MNVKVTLFFLKQHITLVMIGHDWKGFQSQQDWPIISVCELMYVEGLDSTVL